jgi:hypothetical protein
LLDVPDDQAHKDAQWVHDAHRELSPRCPRVIVLLTNQKPYIDTPEYRRRYKIEGKATGLHYKLTWRDADELDLSKEDRKTPMLIIGS